MLGLKQGDTGELVGYFQSKVDDVLRMRGLSGIEVDRDWGPNTTKGFATACGMTLDGKGLSPEVLGLWQLRRLASALDLEMIKKYAPKGTAASIDFDKLDERYVNEATAKIVDSD